VEALLRERPDAPELRRVASLVAEHSALPADPRATP
jgi:hypothetical protein